MMSPVGAARQLVQVLNIFPLYAFCVVTERVYLGLELAHSWVRFLPSPSCSPPSHHNVRSYRSEFQTRPSKGLHPRH